MFIILTLGAEVYGIDYNKLWIYTFKSYLDRFQISLSVYPLVGDAAKLPFTDSYFDVVISIESISHYRDTDSFLLESFRVLKCGGALIISDSNNGANPLTRWKNRKIWERFENGPPSDNFHGHMIEKSFLNMRKDIIRKHFPDLNDEAVNKLAKRTSGMGLKEIVDSVSLYINKGIIPHNIYKAGIPPLNPITNDYIECLINPNQLKRKMESIGFRVCLFSHFGGAGCKNIISFINYLLRKLTPLTIYFARSFKIFAIKM